MSPQGDNSYVIGTLFCFGCSFLTVVDTTFDIWRTSICVEARVGIEVVVEVAI